MILIALVLAVLAILSPVLLAARETGSVMGRVKGLDGETVLGATVTIHRGEEHYSARARATGSYYIGGVPPGAYDLLVRAGGYHDMRHSGIEVMEGQEMRVDLILTEARHESPTDAPADR